MAQVEAPVRTAVVPFEEVRKGGDLLALEAIHLSASEPASEGSYITDSLNSLSQDVEDAYSQEFADEDGLAGEGDVDVDSLVQDVLTQAME
jgi:hypothetical protein